MAITVTSDLADITTADTLTLNGQFYRLNGVNSGNPAQEADAFIQGGATPACVAYKCGTTSGATDTGGHFNSTLTFDLTNKHLFLWRLIVTAGNMQTKANQGVVIGLTNTSTTSTSAWSTTNMKKWYVDGSDTMPASAGWKSYTIDPSSAGDASAGTLTLSTVKNVGILCRQVTGVGTGLNNVFNDAIRMGTGLTATANSGADTITFQNLYDTDKITANAWGIITQTAGIFYGAAKINIGSTSQANACNFTDSNQVLVWRDYPVANTLYEFLLKGASGNKTTMTLNGCVIRGQAATAVWAITCNDAYSDFKAYTCSFANIRQATLSAGSVLDGCTVSQSGTITSSGATITGCTFKPATATNQISVAAGANAQSISNSSFTSGGSGHALVLTGAAANTTLTNVDFSSYAASDGSTGNEAVYVNIATGSMNLTISGGSTPSIRTAGCSVTVISGAVNVTAKAVTEAGANIQSAKVHLEADSGGTLPSNVTVTIANSGTTATVTHTGHGMATNDKVVIRAASHDANNGVFSITKINNDSYSYTMASAPGSNPTGTIKATFVVLSGDTNASGEISMSRVFPSNQPVKGQIRKSTGSPYYKQAALTGTVNSSSGATLTGVMISDD